MLFINPNNIIGTVVEMKDELYSGISDMSKDTNGFRTRYNYMACTVEELMADYAYWMKASDAAIEEENAAQADNKADFEDRINTLIRVGSGGRSGAMRWILQAEGNDLWGDLEHFFWGLNLSWEANAAYCKEFAHLEDYNFQLQDEAPEVKGHCIPKYTEAEIKWCEEQPYFL